MTSERIPLLFDTDIGSDIDDAVALAYLLRQPRCELLGVTTVTGDVGKRAALVEVLCRAAGREEVPVYAGLTGPLLFGCGQPGLPQYAAIEAVPHRRDYAPGAALPFLRETIRARPGEIVLLATGPMTNIGALFAADPELPGLLRAVVLMCGVFTAAAGHGPAAREWNALVDPLATALAFRYGAKRLTSVGLDVTMKCQLPRAICQERFEAAGEPLKTVRAMAEIWFEHASVITFHDPLAAALVFEPGLCDLEEGEVEVLAEPGPLEGLTAFRHGDAGAHRIATAVRPEAFFAHYFGVTGGGGKDARLAAPGRGT